MIKLIKINTLVGVLESGRDTFGRIVAIEAIHYGFGYKYLVRTASGERWFGAEHVSVRPESLATMLGVVI